MHYDQKRPDKNMVIMTDVRLRWLFLLQQIGVESLVHCRRLSFPFLFFLFIFPLSVSGEDKTKKTSIGRYRGQEIA